MRQRARHRAPGRDSGLRLLLVLLLLAAAAAAHTGPEAARQKEIAKEKAALASKIRAAERQAKALASEISESDARRAALERDIASTAREMAGAEARLSEAVAAFEQAETELLRVEADLAAAIARADELRRQAAARTRKAYKAGPGSYVGMLLEADSFRDFLSRFTFVSGVLSEDRARAGEMEAVGRDLDRRRAEALQRREEVAALRNAVEAEKNGIEELRERLAGARQTAVAESARHRQLLTRVETQKAEYLRAMERLEAESRRIADLLRSRQRGQVFQAGSGKRLAWPTTGAVTSGYGWRTHPVFGDRRFHAGIDIGGPSGQGVVAAEAGEVIFAGSKGGYGLTVIVDHGGALATLYAHLSRTSVSPGAKVTRGGRVGSVGCSGYCTGPHLHFETRIKGDPVDPMRFF